MVEQLYSKEMEDKLQEEIMKAQRSTDVSKDLQVSNIKEEFI